MTIEIHQREWSLQVLAGIEMELTDAQFSELCSRLQFVSGHMTYAQFVENFEDPRLGGSTETLHKVSNHRVNAIRGDEYGLDADTVERKLSNKLRDNFQVDIRRYHENE